MNCIGGNISSNRNSRRLPVVAVLLLLLRVSRPTDVAAYCAATATAASSASTFLVVVNCDAALAMAVVVVAAVVEAAHCNWTGLNEATTTRRSPRSCTNSVSRRGNGDDSRSSTNN